MSERSRRPGRRTGGPGRAGGQWWGRSRRGLSLSAGGERCCPIQLYLSGNPPRAAEPRWHLTATVAESCSCTVSCPCNFGGEPTKNPCEGNRLIAIKSGNYEDVDLSGVSFLVTFTMRSWSKIYVSDKVSDRQMAAVG